MAPYLGDVFRGTVERRVLGANESTFHLELAAARDAVAAAGMRASDVDLLIACSFVPRTIGVGNAVFLARALETPATAWNLESACSGALVALDTACAAIATGRYRNALIVTSCNYSQTTDPASVLAWTVGDGAAAFVVGPVDDGFGLLGGRTIPTIETTETFCFEAHPGRGESMELRMRASAHAGLAIRESSLAHVRTCCEAAAKNAGVRIADIDRFVVNTPMAWFSSFVARALDVPHERFVDGYTRYANVGPVLWVSNLHLAARTGQLRRGDLVMLYAIGSASTASAQVVRWNDVAMGKGEHVCPNEHR